MLALSTVEDIGFLTFGVAASTIGFEGAVLGAATHAVAKALLFISISSPEANGELQADSKGLASRYPVSAAASSLECWRCLAFLLPSALPGVGESMRRRHNTEEAVTYC